MGMPMGTEVIRYCTLPYGHDGPCVWKYYSPPEITEITSGPCVHNHRDHLVYWRSHGCDLPYGHTEPCVCQCYPGMKHTWNYLTEGDKIYGEDIATAVRKPASPHVHPFTD